MNTVDNILIETEFLENSNSIKNINKKPTNSDLLLLYKYYKQSTIGDCNIRRPTGFLDIKNKAKWDAWNEIKGMSKIDSMINYNEIVKKIIN